jgi:hypothetical protein
MRVTACIGLPVWPLYGASEASGGNWTNQQAPGFWAQKSSNCWASEPAAGVGVPVAVVSVLVLVSGDVVPPLAVSPDVVPVLPVVLVPEGSGVLLPDVVLLSVDELLELGLVLSLLVLLLLAAAAAAGAWLETGIVTSAGGPGTCGAAGSLPPHPAATSVRRATVMIRARRVAPIFLTPP